MIETVLAQPDTGSPNNSLRITIKSIANKEITKLKVPIQVAIDKGISEKLIKPSME